MQTIKKSFSEIRTCSEKILHFVAKLAPWQQEVDFETSFNHDLELAGLDWDEFLVEYKKQFGDKNLKGLDTMIFSTKLV